MVCATSSWRAPTNPRRWADLAPAAVRAMDEAGLFALKLPAELGGAEADPVTQLEVIERMAYNDPSAGWAQMIGATSIGWIGAFLPDESVAQIFAGGRIPTAAGIGGVSGTALPVEGGYSLTGTFAFVSGIPHSEWLVVSARIQREDEPEPDAPPEVRAFVFRTSRRQHARRLAGRRAQGQRQQHVLDRRPVRAGRLHVRPAGPGAGAPAARRRDLQARHAGLHGQRARRLRARLRPSRARPDRRDGTQQAPRAHADGGSGPSGVPARRRRGGPASTGGAFAVRRHLRARLAGASATANAPTPGSPPRCAPRPCSRPRPAST